MILVVPLTITSSSLIMVSVISISIFILSLCSSASSGSSLLFSLSWIAETSSVSGSSAFSSLLSERAPTIAANIIRYTRDATIIFHFVFDLNPIILLYHLRSTKLAFKFVFCLNMLSTSLPLRSEEHTSELQSRGHLVCRLLLEKKNKFNRL